MLSLMITLFDIEALPPVNAPVPPCEPKLNWR